MKSPLIVLRNECKLNTVSRHYVLICIEMFKWHYIHPLMWTMNILSMTKCHGIITNTISMTKCYKALLQYYVLLCFFWQQMIRIKCLFVFDFVVWLTECLLMSNSEIDWLITRPQCPDLFLWIKHMKLCVSFKFNLNNISCF